MRVRILLLSCLVAVPVAAEARVFGTVRVIVRDQQNLAVAGAEASIKAAAWSWSQTAVTDAQGEAIFPAVPAGQYLIAVNALSLTSNAYLTGIDNSFAGTHYANPREGTIQLRWKFNY